MPPLAVQPSLRFPFVPPVALAAIAVAVACAGDATAPRGPAGVDGARALHIFLGGAAAPPVVHVGAFGTISFTLAIEDAAGQLTPVTGRQVVWGSTSPSVAEAFASTDRGLAVVRRNGQARIIAELDGMRDTVTLKIAQLAVAARVLADTVVALTADAVDLSGGLSLPEPMGVSAVRVDSNGYEVRSAEEIVYEASEDAPFAVVPDSRGGAAIVGTRRGEGKLIVRLGRRADTVLVQVTDAYRVVRLVETPSGVLRVLPDTTHIPPGAAVIFQNEASFTTIVGGGTDAQSEWRAGPIPVHGREAQRFAEPSVYPYTWGGRERAIVVTP